MNVTIKFEGLKEVIANMDDLAKKQVPYALSKALNKTTEDVKAEMVKQMPAKMDRPTPFTLNSLYIKYANKSRLVSEVGYKDKSQAGKGNPAANWMHPQVEGGKRNVKRFEAALQRIGVLPKGMFVAPGAACQLDAYGNIPAGLIVQVLSYFRAFGEQGYRANITDKRKAALKKGSKRLARHGYEYFVSYGPGTDSGRQHLPAGIYKKVNLTGQGQIKPIMMFVKEPSYGKRFPFYEIAQKVIDKNLEPNFNAAMQEALLSAPRSGY
jgi:hypothetical protein